MRLSFPASEAMDAVGKALRKLSEKERARIKYILGRLRTRDYKGLDIKKLKGREDVFRARKGDVRILYRIDREEIFILAIERRSEKTYR